MALFSFPDGASRLVLVSCLPLVDGLFATLLVSGGLSTVTDIVLVGVTVLGGAGSITVLYRYSDSVREAQRLVLAAATVLIPGAVVVGLVAPVFDAVFAVDQLRIAGGIAVLVIAGEFLGLRCVDRFSVPAVLVTGFALSFQGVASVTVTTTYVVPAVLAAVMAVTGLFLASLLLRYEVDAAVVRRGGGCVLVLIALSLFGLQVPSTAAVTVFAGSVAAAAAV